jgi:sialidase-1
MIKRSLMILLPALLITAASINAGPPAGEPAKYDLFVGGEDGYNTYRIPAMILTSDGTLLAFCEGRVNNQLDWGDIDLVLKRSFDNGITWGPLQVIHDDGAHTIGNPAPVVDRDTGRIWLPFCWNNDRVFVTFSDDEGATWAEPREITEDVKLEGWGWYATGPVHAVQLSSGRLLIPCDHTEGGVIYSHAIYSDDHGETWRLGGSVAMHTDEATVVELANGSIYINMRNHIPRPNNFNFNWHRAWAVSRDRGESWSKVDLSRELRTPNCQGSVLRYTDPSAGDKSRILFSSPRANFRSGMTIWISYDEARTWPVKKLITPMPAAYSDMAVLPDMSIGLLYETGPLLPYSKTTYERFTLKWLTNGKDSIE